MAVTHNVLFVMTHLGSDWHLLAGPLSRSPRVKVVCTESPYAHPEDVRRLCAVPHWRGADAVWADVVLRNEHFTMKRLCRHWRMVFWSKPFDECADEIVRGHGYTRSQAEEYYSYRLAGMEAYWRRRGCRDLWNPSLEGESLLAAVLG